MSITLHIERVVIDEALMGTERAGDVRLQIERELARRLTDPGATSGLRDAAALNALTPASLPAARHPREQLGTRIAAAVGDGLRAQSTTASPIRGHVVRGAQP